MIRLFALCLASFLLVSAVLAGCVTPLGALPPVPDAGSICASGFTECRPDAGSEYMIVCVDMMSDTQNCGACGNVCSTNNIGDSSCVNGECHHPPCVTTYLCNYFAPNPDGGLDMITAHGCGAIPDGCGGMLDCGTCPNGEQCGEPTSNTCARPNCRRPGEACSGEYSSAECCDGQFCGLVNTDDRGEMHWACKCRVDAPNSDGGACKGLLQGLP